MATLSNFSCSVSVSCTFSPWKIIANFPRLSDLNELADFIFFTLLLDLLATPILFLGRNTFSLLVFFNSTVGFFGTLIGVFFLGGTKFGVWEREIIGLVGGVKAPILLMLVVLLILNPVSFAS